MLIVIYNGFDCDYYFIIKRLAKELKKYMFNCLGENTKKCINFTVPIEKEVIRIDKKWEEITKIMSNILQFVDSTRFMGSLLSNLVNYLSDGFNKIRFKYWHNDKKCETCGIKYKCCHIFLV